jgi:CheY-like chemotaxis protein
VRILVVDDNKDIVELLKSLLESVEYEVTSAQNGKECLNLISKETFDIILLDITMPEVSGLDVVQNLHDSGNLEKNKVILFTAASISDTEIEKWIKMGVRACLRKPFGPELLFETVSNVNMQG